MVTFYLSYLQKSRLSKRNVALRVVAGNVLVFHLNAANQNIALMREPDAHLV